jgi:hypothetical protein
MEIVPSSWQITRIPRPDADFYSFAFIFHRDHTIILVCANINLWAVAASNSLNPTYPVV